MDPYDQLYKIYIIYILSTDTTLALHFLYYGFCYSSNDKTKLVISYQWQVFRIIKYKVKDD